MTITAKDPMKIIKELETIGKYKFKGVGITEYYLGGISRKEVGKEKYQTVMSAKTYIGNVCDMNLRNYHSFTPLY